MIAQASKPLGASSARIEVVNGAQHASGLVPSLRGPGSISSSSVLLIMIR